MKCKRDFGFTLVELMVVVLILGALAFVAVPRLSVSSTTAKTNACKTNVNLLNSQAELMFSTTRSWPADLAALTENTAFFPDGPPTCPYGEVYVYGTNHRIAEHTH